MDYSLVIQAVLNGTANRQNVLELMMQESALCTAVTSKINNLDMNAMLEGAITQFLINNNCPAVTVNEFLNNLVQIYNRQDGDCFSNSSMHKIIDPITSLKPSSQTSVIFGTPNTKVFNISKKEGVVRNRDVDYQILNQIQANLESGNYVFLSPNDDREEIMRIDEEECFEILNQLIPDLRDANLNLSTDRRVKLISTV